MIHYKLTFIFSIAIIFLLLLFSRKVHGYAEIHYTFFRYSLISHNHPEMLIDMPWRVDAGEPVPVVCIIKDADRFPVKLKRIILRYGMKDGETREKSFLPGDRTLYISDHYWSMLSSIELPDGETGYLKVAAEIEYTRKGIRNIIASDNFPGLSHAPFEVFVSPYKLPDFDGWYYGDAHYHSDMTHDQAEFGAPVAVAALMGKAVGLSWLAASDHSYDLDRAVGEYFKHDAKLTRWYKVRADAAAVNSKNDGFVVLPAEEISCGNSKSRNVHLLAYDTPQFIPGSGDGIKRGLNRRPDLTLRQCFNRISDAGGFCYAAHPEEGNGFMGALFLNRDRWRDKDYAQGGYTGLQFWNGVQDKEYHRAYRKWVQLLLAGRKLYVLGGNDAHGDFNRCRRIKYPNTRLTEDHEHVLGRTRTYAYCGDKLSVAGIHEALRNGRTIVTNGPVAVMQIQNTAGETAMIGGEIAGGEFALTITARSSEEFGQIDKVVLYRGSFPEKIEHLECTFVPEKGKNAHVFTHKIAHKNRGYVRVEATSSARGRQYLCITNPIWLRLA